MKENLKTIGAPCHIAATILDEWYIKNYWQIILTFSVLLNIETGRLIITLSIVDLCPLTEFQSNMSLM